MDPFFKSITMDDRMVRLKEYFQLMINSSIETLPLEHGPILTGHVAVPTNIYNNMCNFVSA